jgi:hypothetical protein
MLANHKVDEQLARHVDRHDHVEKHQHVVVDNKQNHCEGEERKVRDTKKLDGVLERDEGEIDQREPDRVVDDLLDARLEQPELAGPESWAPRDLRGHLRGDDVAQQAK